MLASFMVVGIGVASRQQLHLTVVRLCMYVKIPSTSTREKELQSQVIQLQQRYVART